MNDTKHVDVNAHRVTKTYYDPAMTMAGALSVTPVRPYVRLSNDVRSLSQILLIRIL